MPRVPGQARPRTKGDNGLNVLPLAMRRRRAHGAQKTQSHSLSSVAKTYIAARLVGGQSTDRVARSRLAEIRGLLKTD